jgi:hypothetical protein
MPTTSHFECAKSVIRRERRTGPVGYAQVGNRFALLRAKLRVLVSLGELLHLLPSSVVVRNVELMRQ